MAEIGLAIAGLVLAWKGIVDLGQLVRRFQEDDDRQRNNLLLLFQGSRFKLEDWDRDWETDRSDGRFYRLPKPRQEFIKALIISLEKSASEALEILEKKYRMIDLAQAAAPKKSEFPMSRIAAKVSTVAQKKISKAQWIMSHQDVVQRLLDESERLYNCLNGVASVSPRFYDTRLEPLRVDPRPQVSLVAVVEQVMKAARDHRLPAQQSQTGVGLKLEDDVDRQTLCSLTSQSIPSSRQAFRVQRHLETAFDSLGDTRVSEHIAEWWNARCSGLLIVETADEADDRTSVSACVLLYFLVECHKFVYVFEANAKFAPREQMLDMLRVMAQFLFALQGDRLLSTSCQQGLRSISDGSTGPLSLSQVIPIVFELLQGVLATTDKRVVLIIAGLEAFEPWESSDLCQGMHMWLQSLNKLWKDSNVRTQSLFNVLIGCKGYATALYNCGESVEVAGLTDHYTRSTTIGEELAAALNL